MRRSVHVDYQCLCKQNLVWPIQVMNTYVGYPKVITTYFGYEILRLISIPTSDINTYVGYEYLRLISIPT